MKKLFTKSSSPSLISSDLDLVSDSALIKGSEINHKWLKQSSALTSLLCWRAKCLDAKRKILWQDSLEEKSNVFLC